MWPSPALALAVSDWHWHLRARHPASASAWQQQGLAFTIPHALLAHTLLWHTAHLVVEECAERALPGRNVRGANDAMTSCIRARMSVPASSSSDACTCASCARQPPRCMHAWQQAIATAAQAGTLQSYKALIQKEG